VRAVDASEGATWVGAVRAYYAALLSGSAIAEHHVLARVRGVVDCITSMPSSPAQRVLVSLGALAEESPLEYGSHCIEAAVAVSHASAARVAPAADGVSSSATLTAPAGARQSALRPSARRHLIAPLHDVQQQQQQQRGLSAAPALDVASVAASVVAAHRVSLVDSSARVAALAVSRCMHEGRWEAALAVATELPRLLRDRSAPHGSRGATRTTSTGIARVHFGAYCEALHAASRAQQETAIAMLLQMVRDEQQQRAIRSEDRNGKGALVPGVGARPELVLDGLRASETQRLLMRLRHAPGGWRIASLLFTSSSVTPFSMPTQPVGASAAGMPALLLETSVLHASLTVLADHERWREAAHVLRLRTEAPLAVAADSATVSTAVRVLRHSPWSVALELVSRLCVAPSCGALDAQAAAAVASVVLGHERHAQWFHAAGAFRLVQAADGRSAKDAAIASRLTVKLLLDGRPQLAARALGHVRATGDRAALGDALNAFALAAPTLADCDQWLTTMVEDGVEPSRRLREHIVRLHCDAGDWCGALNCAGGLFTSETVPASPNISQDSAGESDRAAREPNDCVQLVGDEQEQLPAIVSQQRALSARTHQRLQRALWAAGAPWDAAVRCFVAVEVSPHGRPRSGDRDVSHVAEAFRAVASTCMQQRQDDVARELLSHMIRSGVGRPMP
jgi:hypothetical protein